jgi:hypothetical protein
MKSTKTKPEIDPIHILSWGGGVQSTAITLMMIHQPQRFKVLPKHIIFADPGAEMPATYDHVNRMADLLDQSGFNLIVIKPEIPIDQSDRGLQTVPWFTRIGSDVALLRRQCTREYKIDPIQRKIRELLGYKKGQRIPVGSAITWLGISTDESQRAVPNRIPWIENFYPLIEMGISRSECQILNHHYLNYSVPKSSCYFCPFTKRQEWERRKVEDPIEFDRAVKLDEKIRDLPQFGKSRINNPCFVSGTGYPLSESINHQLTLDFGFDKECSGHCGV